MERVFRFVEEDEVIRVTMPEPFVTLHWDLYLFIPSRTALQKLCALDGGYRPMDDALKRTACSHQRMRKVEDENTIPRWKRLLEDFDAKDPREEHLRRLGGVALVLWRAIRLRRHVPPRAPSVPPPVPIGRRPRKTSPWCNGFPTSSREDPERLDNLFDEEEEQLRRIRMAARSSVPTA